MSLPSMCKVSLAHLHLRLTTPNPFGQWWKPTTSRRWTRMVTAGCPLVHGQLNDHSRFKRPILCALLYFQSWSKPNGFVRLSKWNNPRYQTDAKCSEKSQTERRLATRHPIWHETVDMCVLNAQLILRRELQHRQFNTDRDENLVVDIFDHDKLGSHGSCALPRCHVCYVDVSCLRRPHWSCSDSDRECY